MKIALTRIKKNKIVKRVEAKWGDRQVRIYSGQWSAYWRPNANGYCLPEHKNEAGIYTLSEALNRSSHCGPEKKIYYEFI